MSETGADAQLAALIEGLARPAFLVADGRVRISNAAARSALGSEIDGRDVRLVIRHPAAVERLLDGDARGGEIELVGIGAADRRWTMTIVPLGGGITFVRMEDRSAERAAERMRVDFVANASHELRTPLATIVGYAETLREQADAIDAATRGRFVAIVHDEARRMQRVVEDLISLSRIEAERFTAPTDRIELAPLVDLTRAGHARAAEERGSAIVVESDGALPIVAGDRSELLQVLDNLVANALRYGRPGTPVTVRLRRDGDWVRLTVADRGEGIPAELIPRLTERFFRVDASRSRALGGTGLGLSIVKHIVERHRGRLEIRSRVGTGTEVEVALPAEPLPGRLS